MKGFLFLILTVALTGCMAPSIYYWNQYPHVVYEAELDPSTMPPIRLVEVLQAEIEQAKASEKKIPPGLYANLAYAAVQTGNTGLAKAAALEEIRLFPESNTFLRALLDTIEHSP